MKSKNKPRGFKLAAINIATISGYIEELRVYMNKKCIDILEINITLRDDSISSGEVGLPGYILERKDSKIIRMEGGLPIISVTL